MPNLSQPKKVLIVDDEWDSGVIRNLVGEIEKIGWKAIVANDGVEGASAEEYEIAAPWYVQENRPDAVVLDIKFGNFPDERFRGLSILTSLVEAFPELPILIYTIYSEGGLRDDVMRGAAHSALRSPTAKVEFVDKFVSPDVVVLTLTKMIGIRPSVIEIGDKVLVDTENKQVSVIRHDQEHPVPVDLNPQMTSLFLDLVEAWVSSPNRIVSYEQLERHVDGDRNTLTSRIRDIKKRIGNALGFKVDMHDLILNRRNCGYRIEPL